MKFYGYENSYQFDRELRCLDDFGITNIQDYAQRLSLFAKTCDKDMREKERVKALVAQFEVAWLENKQPYYNIYPSIIPALEKLDMNFPLDTIKLPSGLNELLIRYPVGYSGMRSMLIGYHKTEDRNFIVVNLQACKEDDPDKIGRGMVTFEWTSGTIGDSIIDEVSADASKDPYLIDMMIRGFKVAIAICLIGEDPNLVEREILSKDMSKVNDQNRAQLADKAKRRGKFGFTIGKSLEMIPHLRRPHMWWKPYGPQRKFRKFDLRKGSVIHKNAVNQVPSGNLND